MFNENILLLKIYKIGVVRWVMKVSLTYHIEAKHNIETGISKHTSTQSNHLRVKKAWFFAAVQAIAIMLLSWVIFLGPIKLQSYVIATITILFIIVSLIVVSMLTFRLIMAQLVVGSGKDHGWAGEYSADNYSKYCLMGLVPFAGFFYLKAAVKAFSGTMVAINSNTADKHSHYVEKRGIQYLEPFAVYFNTSDLIIRPSNRRTL